MIPKLPQTISKLTKDVYHPSAITLEAESERNRNVFAEDFDLDHESLQSLNFLSLIKISEMFDKYQYLDKMLQKDLNILLTLLSVDLPWEVSVKCIENDLYWKRCYENKWPTKIPILEKYTTWKQTYFCNYLQDYIEDMQPSIFDENNVKHITDTVKPFLKTLRITQMKMVRKPPLPDCSDGVIRDECIIPDEEMPVDHIPLGYILKELIYMTEIDITFGVNNIGALYEERLFKFSADDCKSLCNGMVSLPNLTILRIRRSLLDDEKVKIVMQFVAVKHSIETIDFSHCKIGDLGAAAIADVILTHPNVKALNLQNNSFQEDGFRAISVVLSKLEKINLRLNSISLLSAKYLYLELGQCKDNPRKLNLAGCGLKDEAAFLIADMLEYNRGLTKLDLSANVFKGEAEKTLTKFFEECERFVEIDLRNTGVSENTKEALKMFMKRSKRPL